MVTRHDHFLRGARFLGGGASPRILKRTDQEFIPALLAELRTEEGREAARATLAGDREEATSALRLYQPVHRVFHLAVLEAFCDELGNPRVDPRRVESAGVVVRRLARPTEVRGGRVRPLPYDTLVEQARRDPKSVPVEGWMKEGERVAGWVPLDGRGPGPDADPDPERRRPALRAGHLALTAELALRLPRAPRYAEATSALFVAPPDACAAAGATLLYGMVPLASSDRVEALPEPPRTDEKGVGLMVPEFLRPRARPGSVVLRGAPDRMHGGGTRPEAPGTQRWYLPEVLLPERMPDIDVEGDYLAARMGDLSLLRGTGAFDGSPAAEAFLAYLDQVTAWDPSGELPDRGLGGVLAEAARLFEQDERKGLGRVWAWRMPAGAAWHRGLRDRLKPLLDRTLDELTAGAGRFDRRDALYHVRAFVRLRRCDGCPPELVWSDPSEPFRIVPWYEAGGPPVRVQLPEARLSDMARLKPNVAFEVPASVQDLLAGMKIKKPLDVQPGNLKLGVAWICGFSIPLITLCAFIVLSIFLMLLNIVFWWLPFIKICIPIPRISASERP
jgi:hypothetical protein